MSLERLIGKPWGWNWNGLNLFWQDNFIRESDF